MNKFIKETLSAHISSNRICYIAAFIAVIIGIIIGIFSGIKSAQVSEIQYTETFLSAYTAEDASPFKIFTKSVLLNLRPILIIWLSSWFIWLTPVAFVELGAKSFGFGYSLSYLILDGGFRGLAFSLTALMLQNLILLPVLIIYTVLQVIFSGEFDKVKKASSLYKEKKRLLLRNLLSVIFVLIPILFCGLIDAYITPFFINFLI